MVEAASADLIVFALPRATRPGVVGRVVGTVGCAQESA